MLRAVKTVAVPAHSSTGVYHVGAPDTCIPMLRYTYRKKTEQLSQLGTASHSSRHLAQSSLSENHYPWVPGRQLCCRI